jgi:hypothetical protein
MFLAMPSWHVKPTEEGRDGIGNRHPARRALS